jgi:hypothetical protein
VFDLKEYLTKLKDGTWARLPTIRKGGDDHLKLIAGSLGNIENYMRMDRELP